MVVNHDLWNVWDQLNGRSPLGVFSAATRARRAGTPRGVALWEALDLLAYALDAFSQDLRRPLDSVAIVGGAEKAGLVG